MLRRRKVCRSCKAGKCDDRPTELEPLLIPCLRCRAQGCKACNQSGYHEFAGCPKQAIDDKTASVLFAGDMARNGIFPAGGGWAEQTHLALEAIRLAWAAESLVDESGD